jgi:hypothetical protein
LTPVRRGAGKAVGAWACYDLKKKRLFHVFISGESVQFWEKQGYRVVPVEIRELPPKGKKVKK